MQDFLEFLYNLFITHIFETLFQYCPKTIFKSFTIFFKISSDFQTISPHLYFLES